MADAAIPDPGLVAAVVAVARDAGQMALARWRTAGEGPTPEQRARGKFIVTFVGRAGDRIARTEVRGHDPGYDHTSKMIAEAALTLVEDRDRLPHAGGVLTPVSALHEPLLARLRGTGMEFRTS